MSEAQTQWRVRVRCPECKRDSFVPPGFVGRVGLCPGCRDPLRIPDPGRPPKRAQEAVAALPPLDLPPLEPELLERARWGVNTGWEEVDLALAPDEDLNAHCRACGEPIRERAQICAHCGEYQLEGGDRERAGGIVAAAGWKRGLAFLINALILSPAVVAAVLAWGSWDQEPWAPSGAFVPLAVLASVGLLVVGYVQARFSARYAASIGKKLLGLKVIRGDGQPATLLGGVLLREGLFWVLLTPLCAGLGLVVHGLSALLVLTGQPRALHDMIAGTLVVEAGS
ncbi:MAG: RDD family protein [Planctomycetes bacterium]|nr:RDD family protein [Planctomycetota bacterium]